jgi:hypothetical protein
VHFPGAFGASHKTEDCHADHAAVDLGDDRL